MAILEIAGNPNEFREISTSISGNKYFKSRNTGLIQKAGEFYISWDG